MYYNFKNNLDLVVLFIEIRSFITRVFFYSRRTCARRIIRHRCRGTLADSTSSYQISRAQRYTAYDGSNIHVPTCYSPLKIKAK